MMPGISRLSLLAVVCVVAFGQSTEAPLKFEFADVHVTPKGSTLWARNGPVLGGRYELRLAKMVDLVRVAYGIDVDHVLGGPSWLEMDRFDLIAKVPDNTSPEALKEMLRTLLADRFKLAVHKEIRPLPTFVLTSGMKPQLKQAEGAGDAGCRASFSSGVITASNPGSAVPIKIKYVCRNMTMSAFAGELGGMIGLSIGTSPVLDQTGLKGAWNFDVNWSLQRNGTPGPNPGDTITIFEAVEKQLGLKLDQKQVPTPVVVVDSVNRVPTDNPPGTSEALPVIPRPAEFEVADVRPTDPGSRSRNFQLQPGGRLVATGMPMQFLLRSAFFGSNSEQLVGAPKWVDSERFDITAKAQWTNPATRPLDAPSVAPILRSLLVKRFGLKYHAEDRQVSAYRLVAGKPKMKKADPASRTWCKPSIAPAGSPPGSQLLTCQNITMAEFAEELQGKTRELIWPVVDATGIEGGWDFTLTFSQNAGLSGARGGDPGQPGADAAVDPSGDFTLLEAVEKQLGLKLEPVKRPMPVFVIDHIEQRPTEN
jgi:uncharacterized protein (TIGR03435 family)